MRNHGSLLLRRSSEWKALTPRRRHSTWSQWTHTQGSITWITRHALQIYCTAPDRTNGTQSTEIKRRIKMKIIWKQNFKKERQFENVAHLHNGNLHLSTHVIWPAAAQDNFGPNESLKVKTGPPMDELRNKWLAGHLFIYTKRVHKLNNNHWPMFNSSPFEDGS